MPDGMLHPTLSPGVSQDDRWHRMLVTLNESRFCPALPGPNWASDIADQAALLVQEGHWLEGLRADVAARAAEAPHDPKGFIAWFEQLEHNGPGQNDPLFPWLAEQATMEEMRWFLQQEVAGEAGFEDRLLARQGDEDFGCDATFGGVPARIGRKTRHRHHGLDIG